MYHHPYISVFLIELSLTFPQRILMFAHLNAWGFNAHHLLVAR